MFSVSNSKEKLTYPVGLLTGEEADLFNPGAFEMSDDFHLMIPLAFMLIKMVLMQVIYILMHVVMLILM